MTVLIITLFTCGFGISLIVDAMFIHLDAQVDVQGGLVFAVVPLWQWACLLVVALALIIFNKAKSE